jgi:hypothetical protein
MDHPVVVRVRECARYVAKDPDGVGDRQLALPTQLGAEALSFDERHGVVQQPIACPGAQQRDDMRMLKARGDVDLALKPFGVDRLGELRL